MAVILTRPGHPIVFGADEGIQLVPKQAALPPRCPSR
jgi:hypothetical protein